MSHSDLQNMVTAFKWLGQTDWNDDNEQADIGSHALHA